MIRVRSGSAANTSAGTSSTTVGTIASKCRAASIKRSVGYVSSVAFSCTSYRSRSVASIGDGSVRTTKTRDLVAASRLTLGSPTLLATNRHALVFVGRPRLCELCDVRRAPVDRQRPREQQPDECDRNVLNERDEERHCDGGVLV